MRIQLTLEPSLFAKPVAAAAGPSSSPLAQLGGEIVLIELQGELNWQGEKAGGVVGVIGLDRPDKPTLHLGPHHLLHGKFTNLPKPLAVIRRGTAAQYPAADGAAVQGDVDEEEEEEEEEDGEGETSGSPIARKSRITPNLPTPPGAALPKKRKANLVEHSDDEDDPPLFPEPSTPIRPLTKARLERDESKTPTSSSPFLPASSMRDFSSELDFSSPPRSSPGGTGRDGEDDGEGEEDGLREEQRAEMTREQEKEKRRKEKLEVKRAERRAQRPERTRTYEVVGLVRRKVVFALR